MKKLAVLLPAALAFALALVPACDGSNVVPCETDDDCADNADAPVCDTDLGQCVGEEAEPACTEDVQCQVDEFGGGDECDDNAGCGADEVCATGSEGKNYCVIGPPCAGGTSEATAPGPDGDQTFCTDDAASCGEDGECVSN
jgi:hypothetical protein